MVSGPMWSLCRAYMELILKGSGLSSDGLRRRAAVGRACGVGGRQVVRRLASADGGRSCGWLEGWDVKRADRRAGG